MVRPAHQGRARDAVRDYRRSSQSQRWQRPSRPCALALHGAGRGAVIKADTSADTDLWSTPQGNDIDTLRLLDVTLHPGETVRRAGARHYAQTVQVPRLRHSARALLLDAEDRLLLARHDLTSRHIGSVIWAPPGGGLEVGETALEAVVRELAEEVGLDVPMDSPRHVWHQQVVSASYAEGWDGAVFHYFLVRCGAADVASTSTEELLEDEGITEFRWWTLDQLRAASDEGWFRPHHLPALLGDLLTHPAGSYPIAI